MREELLRVEGLVKHFPVTAGVFGAQVGSVKAVDGVSFEVRRGETLGLVGESGCGKTTVGRTLLRLEEPTAGRVWFDGVDLTGLSPRDLRSRRRDLQMVFQDPMSSLNPRMMVQDIVGESLRVHRIARGAALEARVIDLLEKVGIPGAWRTRYPHEFSGGQRQRIGVARALATGPRFVVCDEAVSALDVSVQAQVVNLLISLREELDLSYLFIAHDLSVVKHISHRIAVMYLGQIVERADSARLFTSAVHPYTRALLSAIPVPDPTRPPQRMVLQGDVPSPLDPPAGCRFHTRCPAVMPHCRSEEPPVVALPDGHEVKCFLAKDLPPGEDWRRVVEQRTEEAVANNPVPEAITLVPEPEQRATPPAPDAKRPVPWLAIAAGLVGILFLAALLSGPSRSERAVAQRSALAREIEGYAETVGEYPRHLRDLGWRLHEIFRRGEPNDPWGRAWVYRRGSGDFELLSHGPDGAPGGGDDVVRP